MSEVKKFCLITTGRAGSTSLINSLAAFDDIGLPSAHLDCEDNELLHPARVAGYCTKFADLFGRIIVEADELVDLFYKLHESSEFAGFKTMFNRHADLANFLKRPDIQFISLVRSDVSATVASFIHAMEMNTWRREGGQPDYRWRFDKAKGRRVFNNIQFVFNSHLVLQRIPGVIALDYESICKPDFISPPLDEFFGRHISLLNPLPPTDASKYVVNWYEFDEFVKRQWLGLTRQLESSKASSRL